MNKHGFTLIQEKNLSEVGGAARLWRHDRTGAELLSIVNADENKSFGVSFRTPPRDSTGVAHILEHSVLCGSQRYPVKEPFVELLKGSLQTFLNALTFPDKTCYPVASANLRDFYHLVDVYLDAVFHPRIDEDVLRQEGWSWEADNPDGPWRYKGVVFNEMKGVYSSPDSILMEESQHAIFPDTLYSMDSGGDPAVIPSLTYAAFRDFHARYYHPSNARFFFWGDDPEDARLEKLAEVLEPYERREPDSAVPLQARLKVERKVEIPYAAGPGENTPNLEDEEDEEDAATGTASADSTDAALTGLSEAADETDGRLPPEDKGHVTVNWLLCEGRETEELFVLEILEHILAGLPGSPLRKALMDSGLGEDLAGSGLETDLRQAYFSLGLRSIRPEDADQVERLMLDRLAELAEAGIPSKAVEAAVNSLEFELRENNTGRFPRGLDAMFRSLSDWLYDGDPFAPLAWEKTLTSLKARLAAGEPVFENAIRRWFLDNTHRVVVLLTPDPTLAERRQKAEDARLERERAALSPAERDEATRATQRLRKAQETPDSPEALATIPTLSVADLPTRNALLPCAEQADVTPILCHELDTTGIVYVRLLLSLDAVPARLRPLLPLYARALTEMGTLRRDYVELGLELSAQTGSLGAAPGLLTRLDDAAPIFHLEVAGKATLDKAGKLTALMREILLEGALDNRERFSQMAQEEKARLEQSIIPSGHSLVALRLGSQLSVPGFLAEEMGGVSSIFFLRELVRRVERDWPSVLADLREIQDLVIRRERALFSLTANAPALTALRPLVRDLALSLPLRPLPNQPLPALAPVRPEALLTPAQVNYTGLGCKLRDTGFVYTGGAAVALRHLRMSYLWDRVRVQGGAYGSFVQYNRATGTLLFLSYRDPNVERTLQVYREAADWLGNLHLSPADMERAVVGAIGDMDAYLLPGAKGRAAMECFLSGDSPERRQKLREEVLSASLRDFHDFAPFLARGLDHATPCVLGGPKAQAAASDLGWAITRIL